MNLKKILATVVATAMILSSMGIVAFAEGTTVASFADFKAAVEAGKSVVLTSDIVTDAAINISGKTVSIDLNGKTLSLRKGDNKLTDAANVEIKNGTINIDDVVVKGNAIICLDEYEKTLQTVLTLNDVDVIGENYSSAYGVFYIGESSVLNVNGGNWMLKNDLHESGGVFKADASGAAVNINGATMDFYNVRRGVTYAATKVEDSSITINGDEETSGKMEHGFNRSPLTIKNSEITMKNLSGRGITVQNGDVTVDATSKISMTNCVEATIDVRNGKTLNVEDGANVVIDKEATVSGGGIISGIVKVETPSQTSALAKIGDTGYETVAAALAAAQAAGMQDVEITLVGETTLDSAKALEDTFDLCYATEFDSVTFTQEDPSKVYYIDSIYTGSRNNGGNFKFDGVNMVVTGQYMFEGNVNLTNNSVVKSVAEANCFIYNGKTTVEPGSKLQGVIEDLRGGELIIDGGREDDEFNTTPDMQDAILVINWSGDSITLNNGAYLKVNSANEVGRMTVNSGTELNINDSKLDSCQWIDNNGTINIDAGSLITTPQIKGAGVININASGMKGKEVQIIKANMSGFTGKVNINGNVDYAITDTGIVLTAKSLLQNAPTSKAQASGLEAFTGETGGIKWCSYSFLVNMNGQNSISATVSANGEEKPLQTKNNWDIGANIDGNTAFGVVVTGVDAVDAIIVDVQ